MTLTLILRSVTVDGCIFTNARDLATKFLSRSSLDCVGLMCAVVCLSSSHPLLRDILQAGLRRHADDFCLRTTGKVQFTSQGTQELKLVFSIGVKITSLLV